jgi:glyoxylase-like metal-dependent hydrolase (beta-lactamase superfamily II)
MKNCRVRIQLGLLLVLALARPLCAHSRTPSPNDQRTISITWLGHAAFEIVSPGGTDLLIDPFLTKNPATPAANKDLARYHPSYILITHSHGDHLGDAVELAKLSKAKLVSVMMLDTLVTKGGAAGADRNDQRWRSGDSRRREDSCRAGDA